MVRPSWKLLACLSLLFGGNLTARAADLLVLGEPVGLKGTKGRFDFIAVDADRRRLLAAHTGNNSLDVIDLDKGELIKVIPTGAAQDRVLSRNTNLYLVSVSKPPQLEIIDAEGLTSTGTVPLAGP